MLDEFACGIFKISLLVRLSIRDGRSTATETTRERPLCIGSCICGEAGGAAKNLDWFLSAPPVAHFYFARTASLEQLAFALGSTGLAIALRQMWRHTALNATTVKLGNVATNATISFVT